MRSASASSAGMPRTRPQYESSASGTPTIMMTFPVYIGCRTSPYSPVETSVWPDSTVILAAALPFLAVTSMGTPWRPAESMVQSADHQHGRKADEHDGADDLLQRSGLRQRSGMHTPLQRGRV